jgi:hypothetical protein
VLWSEVSIEATSAGTEEYRRQLPRRSICKKIWNEIDCWIIESTAALSGQPTPFPGLTGIMTMIGLEDKEGRLLLFDCLSDVPFSS